MLSPIGYGTYCNASLRFPITLNVPQRFPNKRKSILSPQRTLERKCTLGDRPPLRKKRSFFLPQFFLLSSPFFSSPPLFCMHGWDPSNKFKRPPRFCESIQRISERVRIWNQGLSIKGKKIGWSRLLMGFSRSLSFLRTEVYFWCTFFIFVLEVQTV